VDCAVVLQELVLETGYHCSSLGVACMSSVQMAMVVVVLLLLLPAADLTLQGTCQHLEHHLDSPFGLDHQLLLLLLL